MSWIYRDDEIAAMYDWATTPNSQVAQEHGIGAHWAKRIRATYRLPKYVAPRSVRVDVSTQWRTWWVGPRSDGEARRGPYPSRPCAVEAAIRAERAAERGERPDMSPWAADTLRRARAWAMDRRLRVPPTLVPLLDAALEGPDSQPRRHVALASVAEQMEQLGCELSSLYRWVMDAMGEVE